MDKILAATAVLVSDEYRVNDQASDKVLSLGQVSMENSVAVDSVKVPI